jgi:hypothetical protein
LKEKGLAVGYGKAVKTTGFILGCLPNFIFVSIEHKEITSISSAIIYWLFQANKITPGQDR